MAKIFLNTQAKSQNSKLLIEASEDIITNQNSYLKWLIKNQVIGNDDLSKHYMCFENQTIRITNQIYSDSSINNYIKFQAQTSLITIDRLKFFYKINNANRFDSNLMKNFRSVFENLLLSLRLEEKYPHALEQIKVIYTFLNENNNIENEIEWLMANWCKIKRDMWRSKKVPYTDSQKKQTIADYLEMPKRSEVAVKLLFEEIRNYYGFKSVDCNIAMYQEIFHTIEKLETMTIKDMLVNGRLFLEMAQFNWSGSTKKLVLESQEYVALAEECLNDHRCISEKMTNLNLNENFSETDENKENDDLKNILKNNKKRLSSPNSEVILIDDLELSKSNKKLPKRQKRVIQTQSPMIIKNESSASPSVIVLDKKSSQVCGCTMSKILQFQISLYTCLCHYSSLRTKMLDAMKNLVDSRLKLKDKANVLTNADNLYLQTPCTQSLICPEICDEFTVNVDDTELIKKLDSCLNILEEINKSHSLKKIDKTLEKQFYEFVDILAQFYGFLGLILNRSKCLSIKFDILSKHIDQSSQLETIYSNTVINLMKSYLNTCQIDNMECFLKKLFNPDQASQTKTSIKSYDDLDLKQLYEKNSYLLNKPEFQVAYYLNLMHYLILKNKTKEAIKIMKEKILKSPVLSGKQNAYFFETKHCLKYLQFTLSMMNLGKSEDEFMSLIENETPLSLLEECYTCIFSVAKYYTLNSIDPFRFLSSNANQIQKKPETVFFDIGNAESYRILGECLDLTNHLCKHFIDIGRYRDATAYIREGLDVSQLHFSLRRLANFLTLQVHADIIANCFSDSQTRLQIVGNLVKTNEIETTSKIDSELANDLMRINNFVYHSQMSLLNEIRKLSDEENDDLKVLITSKKNFIFKNFSTDSTISNYIKELLIDLELLSLNYLKKNYSKSKSLVNECIKNLKNLLKNGSIKEKWKNAEYLSNLYELDETNRDYLSQAYNYIRKYPHPLLYRKILMQMYNSEASGKNDLKKKCFYLLETQSIALRHKACSIQYKHRRKGTQDAKLIDVLLSNLSFDSVNYLDEFIDEILPENCVVISLVLDEMDGLYVARFESKKEPILVKLKYDRKLSEEFKTIMVDNDRSMKQSDRTKFWSSRSALNKKLSHYLEEFESNVFSVYKSLLLGSYIDINVEKIIEEFKEKFFPNSKLNKNQENLLRLIILGLEEYSTENVMQCLKLEFKNVCYDEMSDYFFIYVRPKIQNARRKHVCLLIDKNLHQIPFECFPTVISQPITRMPSIHFLQNHIKINSLLLNKEKAFYIVDPGCDLAHTRLKFKSLFEKRKTWDGIVGVAPDETIFKKALTEYELFIYTGHGSGSQYYPSDDVQKLRVQACSILMGCSSGNQYVMGDFEPYGTVLAYILAGCPCIVGNLWDVTDRDIDRLTEEFLESWIKDHDEMCEALSGEENKLSKNSILTNSICVHLNKARKACKMSYLNGSAPIVYGLPVNFK
ncbi:unnamed protein product [Brachionus calyciflorus]|uniref:separase n=1 Tax=Brachionus calyciflorus TaxID=104777 RepID=A0A813M2F7_9BILA|nr:unnamed protein product [Brachionus calyciflorus]